MDSGLILRTAGGPARTSGTRRAGTVRNAVGTDLAAPQIVTATPEGTVVRSDTGHAVPDRSSDVAQIILDAQSREVIYRSIDERPGGIARQVPDEALLRLRAYTRAAPDEEPDTHSLETIV